MLDINKIKVKSITNFMRQIGYLLCFIFLSITIISCDNAENESDTNLNNEVFKIPNKALYIGNSLLLGNGTFGMDATDQGSDYHAIIQEKFLKANPAYTDIKVHGVGFEACENETQQTIWLKNTLQPNLSSDLDFVVIQIGDNVNTSEKISAFEQGAKNLIKTIKEVATQARIVWIYGWYVSDNVTKYIQNACEQYGVTLIPISDLNTSANQSTIGTVITRTEPTSQTLNYTNYTKISNNRLQINFTINEKNYDTTINVISYIDNAETKTLTWQGYETITTDSGVASHPGNAGFAEIAKRFFEKLNINLE